MCDHNLNKTSEELPGFTKQHSKTAIREKVPDFCITSFWVVTELAHGFYLQRPHRGSQSQPWNAGETGPGHGTHNLKPCFILSVRMVYLSLKVRGEFIKLGSQCSIGQPVIGASRAVKVTWVSAHELENSWLFLVWERPPVEAPSHQAIATTGPSSSERNLHKGEPWKKGQEWRGRCQEQTELHHEARASGALHDIYRVARTCQRISP